MSVSPEKIAEMLPCPFCGAKPCSIPQNTSFERKDRKGFTVRVWCENCDVLGPERDNDANAIEAWNRRAAQLSGITDETSSDLVPVAWLHEMFSDTPSPRWHPRVSLGDPRETWGDTMVRNVRPLYVSDANEAFGSLIVALAQAGLGVRDKTAAEKAAAGDDLCSLVVVNRPLEAAETLNARQAEALKAITTHHSARTDFSGTTDTLHEIREIARRALATESSNG